MSLTVVANLIVGRNGATSLSGRSRGLSFPEDRNRFHEVRKSAHAILIGGSTFSAEPYQNTELPLFVATRSQIPAAGLMRAYCVTPLQLLDIAQSEFNGQILIEGGVNFLSEILDASRVDILYLTRSPIDGDANFIPKSFLVNYLLVESTREGAGTFETWKRIIR